MKYSRFRLSLLALAVTSVNSVAADELEAIVLDTLRISAPEAQTILGNDTITPEEIEQRNPATIRDVFAGESSITSSGGAGIATKVFVNGIEESLLSVTIDGARQNKSAFHHTGNVLIDPNLLKQVEVSKGLAPADAGPGGLGGSIAYETKDVADLLTPGKNAGGIVSLSVSDNEDFFRATASAYGRSEGAEILLSAARSAGDDYTNGDGEAVPGTEADLNNFLGKAAYTTSGGHRFEVLASRTEDAGTRAGQAGPGGIFFLRPDFSGVVGSDSVFLEGLSRRSSYAFTYTMDDPRGWFDPTVQLTYNEQEIDVSGVYGINESFSGTVKNDFAISNGSVAAGFDFFDEQAHGEGRGPGPFGSSGEENHSNYGLFAQVRQDLGERFSFSYGARVDRQDFEGADGSKFDETGVSGNASVDVILTDTLSLNAGYANTFGGYELGEAALVNFGTPWNYDGFTTSRAQSARLGLRFDSGPFLASGALFRVDVEDINAVLPTNGERGVRSDLQSQGFEGSLGYNWGDGFSKLNYTYADVELDDETIGTTAYYFGRPVGHIFALEAGQRVSDEVSVGGTAEIVLKNDDTEITLPSYEVFNLYVSYEPSQIDGLTVRLDVKNVFDETYSSRSSDGLDSTRVEPLTEPGRAFMLTGTMVF